MSIDKQTLISAAEQFGITLDESQIDKLDRFKDMVVDANEKFNLTSILSEPDFTIKHLVDSLAAAKSIKSGALLLDIGTGAGFPSLPLAVAREDITVVGLDSTEKKTVFLNQAAASLGIANLSAIVGRAEECKQKEHYDAVTARAVAPLNILVELALPLLKVGGSFFAYKTDLSEADTVSTALKTLGAKVGETKSFALPNGDKRAIIEIVKTSRTDPKFPRQYGQIKKKPL